MRTVWGAIFVLVCIIIGIYIWGSTIAANADIHSDENTEEVNGSN